MTCVIVLGPPRCGTSAIAGLLHLLGAHMGDELMEPMAGVNPKGFYEDMDFVRMHIKLMHAHYEPRVDFDVVRQPEADDLEAYGRLIAEHSRRSLWGVKDPKLCFLLPYFLRRYHGLALGVLIDRPLQEAADSMQPLYGGMTLDKAITLQGRYRYALEKNLKAWKHRLELRRFDYGRLVEAPFDEACRLATFCGLSVVNRYDEIKAFVEAGLKHH